MRLLKNFTLLMLFTFMAASCNEDEKSEKLENTEALLLWSGEYMVDGCGFTLQVGEEKLKPDNEDAIPDTFKTAEQTPVTVQFIRTGEQLDRRCGLSSESRAMPGIKIVTVEKR